ncbi:unnamed protein product, partial [Linum tenue]
LLLNKTLPFYFTSSLHCFNTTPSLLHGTVSASSSFPAAIRIAAFFFFPPLFFNNSSRLPVNIPALS